MRSFVTAALASALLSGCVDLQEPATVARDAGLPDAVRRSDASFDATAAGADLLARDACADATCPGNLAPQVNAGPDQTVSGVQTEVQLAGMVMDDGLPAPPALVTSWSKINGPGEVTFQDASSPTTTARFSTRGSYSLRLSASDGQRSSHEDVAIVVLGLTEDLAARWKFDEASGTTAADSSGGNNHGTLVGMARWTTGKLAGALDVTSNEPGLVNIAHPAGGRLDFGRGDFTIALWMKTAQPRVDSGSPHLIAKLHVTASARIGFQLYSGWTAGIYETFFRIGDATTSASVKTTGLDDNSWHHIAAARDGSSIELFIDGKRVGSTNHAVGSLSNTAPLQMGGRDGIGSNGYDGLLDDVRVYHRALGYAEIAALASGREF